MGDALYIDGDQTTAPGLVAQEMQQNQNADQFDYVTPKHPRHINLDEDDDEESVVPADDIQSIASANPLVNDDKLMRNGSNIYHPNRQVNKMMAEMVEQEKIKNGGKIMQKKQIRIQSLRDWCFDNGLNDIYDKLI